MLKTNRILYPNGIAVQAKEFARYIEPNDTRLVTVGNERDRVYRYEGALNGLDDAVVRLAGLEGGSTDDTRTSSLHLEHRSGAE
ncbi:hypothetical protein GsuE55_34780 [Geobacillus subterraneus]|uniref:Uncharacterized protein n=1 Tax=Geobacillus subterraneus TaxID=129338 RepID=A0A679FVC7_9BACL|nr:hypothetical protein B4113_1440 [Geobacillus sp. B4113_201601]BBW98645.1 hypothetical protein GsuE55_34780 [Geobacillus subterraneus]